MKEQSEVGQVIVDRLGKLCDQKGMTSYRLAMKSGVAQSTLCTIFQGKILPSVSTMVQLCKACGISVAQFFAEEGEYPDLTMEQEELLKSYKAMTAREKELTKEFMSLVLENKK